MRVLSLFDGISCGQVALERAGIKVDTYYASEIDKYAIQITQKNYPNTVQIGDVTQVDGNKYEGIDLLIGGSPCQGFSFAGKQLNFIDPRSRLFFEFVRIMDEAKPKYFLLENVKMKKEWADIISEHLRVEPIEINSALVSAQNRRRLYWTNIPNVTQPENKHIYLKDILESGFTDRDKSYCIDANYYRAGDLKSYFLKKRRQLVFEKPGGRYSELGKTEQHLEVRFDEKTNALTMVQKDNLVIEETLDDFIVRRLTPVECERLQTLPDNYTEGVSNTQRYKMLGNGWTVDVITHIFEGLKQQYNRANRGKQGGEKTDSNG